LCRPTRPLSVSSSPMRLPLLLESASNTMLTHRGRIANGASTATVPTRRRNGRLGQASPAASYRYLHAVAGRDAEIAAAQVV